MPNEELTTIGDKIERLVKKSKGKGTILTLDMSSYFKLKEERNYVEEEITAYAGLVVHILPEINKEVIEVI